MTICGFHVISPQRAIVWADTEIYKDGEAVGHVCKLAIGPLTGFAGTGTGSLGMIEAAGAVVSNAPSMRSALTALYATLAAQREDAGASARSLPDWWAYALVGFDPRFGRIVGQVLESQADFAPRPTVAWCVPEIAEPPARVVDDHSALAFATTQLIALRERMPGATGGGTLVLAELDGARITVRPAFDLATGRRPAREPAPEIAAPRGGAA